MSTSTSIGKLLREARLLIALRDDDYSYIYDPRHTENPGHGWRKTPQGWAKIKSSLQKPHFQSLMRHVHNLENIIREGKELEPLDDEDNQKPMSTGQVSEHSMVPDAQQILSSVTAKIIKSISLTPDWQQESAAYHLNPEIKKDDDRKLRKRLELPDPPKLDHSQVPDGRGEGVNQAVVPPPRTNNQGITSGLRCRRAFYETPQSQPLRRRRDYGESEQPEERLLRADEGKYEYRYDPTHKTRPVGAGWQKTDYGWAKGKVVAPVAPVAPDQQKSQGQPEEAPKPIQPQKPTSRLQFVPTRKHLEHILSKGYYSIVSAGKNDDDPEEKEMNPTDPKFQKRTEELQAELEKMGVSYSKALGQYGGSPEHSFMVFHEDVEIPRNAPQSAMVKYDKENAAHVRNQLNQLGEKFNQASVLHGAEGNGFLHFTTGKHKGTECGGKGWNKLPLEIPDYYTDVELHRKKHTKFNVDLKTCFEKGGQLASIVARIVASWLNKE